jgi:hypothetical protein
MEISSCRLTVPLSEASLSSRDLRTSCCEALADLGIMVESIDTIGSGFLRKSLDSLACA